MDFRSRLHEISESRPILPVPPPPPPPPPPLPPSSAVILRTTPNPQCAHSTAGVPSTTRPLSDIREISEPSLVDSVIRKPSKPLRPRKSISRGSSVNRNGPDRADAVDRAWNSRLPLRRDAHPAQETASSSYSSVSPDQSSLYGVPQSSIPRRSSSHKHAQRLNASTLRDHANYAHADSMPNSPKFRGLSIPNRGYSESPVKEAGLRIDPITSSRARRIPSQTHVRNPVPNDILEYPTYKHPRLKLELQVSAPVSVGGGSAEGYVRVTIDDNERLKHRRSFGICAVSVELVGYEEVIGSRRWIFLALGTDLIDAEHPPPPQMIDPPNPLFVADEYWSLVPSCTAMPFMISLPLDTGPPPFQSKCANIRFLLAVTATIKDAGRHYRVRTSQNVHVFPTYDPEKALVSLSSPLTASDDLSMPRTGVFETLKVTAGLHRQVWISGSSIFVDVHIANKCRKPVRKLELSLERDILCYRHAAAATWERSASQARVFETNERSVLSRSLFKPGHLGWSGVESHTSDIRTCELEVPRGYGTVRCGKHFEVRFFVNVTATLTNSKSVMIQLPIILIHMISLDVLPNSVAQVAAAIEEKRAHRRLKRTGSRSTHSRQHSSSSSTQVGELRRRGSYTQGRAFAAPRQQSLDRQRGYQADMEELRNMLDSSPRKIARPVLRDLATNKTRNNMGAFSALPIQTPQNENIEPIADQLRPKRSLDSIRHKLSFRPRNTKEANGHTYRIPPHALGLIDAGREQVNMQASSNQRPATAMSLREKLDRSRFEIRSVRRKASGSLKDRGLGWWESRRPGDKREGGWI